VTPIEIVQEALKEDLPNGDLTIDSLGLTEHKGRAKLVAREDLILSGQEFFSIAINLLNQENQIQWQFNDGDWILKNQTVATISGNLISLLKTERVGLSFLGHFSGIATFTYCFVRQTEGFQCKILDTYETLPLLKQWEKKAVRDGGVRNHPLNLSSTLLIRENHIRLTDGLPKAVEQIRTQTNKPIEVECHTLEEVETATRLSVQRVLLNGMDNETIKLAMEKIPTHIKVIVSGNMSIERIPSIAELGVHYISVGAITHSAPRADFSLLFE